MSFEQNIFENECFVGFVEVANTMYINCAFQNCHFVGFGEAHFIDCIFLGNREFSVPHDIFPDEKI